MEIEQLENKVGDASKTKSNRRKKHRAKKKHMEANGLKIVDQTSDYLEVPEKIIDCNLVKDDLEKNIPGTDSTVQPLVECPTNVSGSSESLPEVITDTKQKKKRKRVKKVKSKDEVVSVDQNMMDLEATGSLAEGTAMGKRRKRKKRKKKAKVKDETLSPDLTDGILNLHSSDGQEVEGKLIEKVCKAQEVEFSPRKESSLSDLAPDKENLLSLCKDAEPVDLSNAIKVSSDIISPESDEVRTVPSLGPMEVEGKLFPLNELKSGINEVVNIECTAQESKFSSEKESSLSDLVLVKGNLLDLCKDEETTELSNADAVEDSSNRISFEFGEVGSRPTLEPIKVERKGFPLEIQHRHYTNPVGGNNETYESVINEVKDEIVVDGENCSAEGKNPFTSCNVDRATHLSTPDVKKEESSSTDLSPRIAPPVTCIKRKLLVLDVNGLLAHILMPPPLDCTADAYILGRAIFKRPFCDDFLKFCFKNFDVGVWSSRSRRIIDRVVPYLLGDMIDKLKFCWDMDHSTHTGYKTLENSHKPLVCKELSKIWENEDPNLPWKKGDYDESNTLLLDDSPYKALLNPLHTAIFPPSYQYQDKNDNSLGPGGDLRVYLEGLQTSDNVQKYVEKHPFGQSAINENNLSWGFYSGVLQTISNRMEHNTPDAIPPLSSL